MAALPSPKATGHWDGTTNPCVQGGFLRANPIVSSSWFLPLLCGSHLQEAESLKACSPDAK